jgi:hypothetical protein
MLQARQPSIVFEADENISRMGYTADDLFDLLTKAAPYTIFRIDDGSALEPARPPYPFGNCLALSPGHAGRI